MQESQVFKKYILDFLLLDGFTLKCHRFAPGRTNDLGYLSTNKHPYISMLYNTTCKNDYIQHKL